MVHGFAESPAYPSHITRHIFLHRQLLCTCCAALHALVRKCNSSAHYIYEYTLLPSLPSQHLQHIKTIGSACSLSWHGVRSKVSQLWLARLDTYAELSMACFELVCIQVGTCWKVLWLVGQQKARFLPID